MDYTKSQQSSSQGLFSLASNQATRRLGVGAPSFEFYGCLFKIKPNNNSRG